MEAPFILIPWSLMTHTFDSIRAEKQQQRPMTYLDLLTTIQNFSEEELLLPVKCYDEDCEEFVDVLRVEGDNEDDPYLII